VIRPLLPLTRAEILSALEERHVSFRHDESNDSETYRRNHIRHQILPRLSEIQPGYESAVGEALLMMQADDATLEEQAQTELESLCLDNTPDNTMDRLRLSRPKLKLLPASLRLRVLRRAIGQLTGGPQSITFHHVRKIEELVRLGADGAQYDLPGRLHFEQGPLVITLSS
jgi:tRNA(Ile)-lysidine synthase